MDDIFAMGGPQGLARLEGDLQGGVDRQGAREPDEGLEVLALDEIHRNVLDAADLAQVVDADDVVVGDGPGEPHLGLEALDDRGVGRELGPDHLERDRGPQLLVFGLVDASHAAAAHLLDDAIAHTEGRARREA